MSGRFYLVCDQSDQKGRQTVAPLPRFNLVSQRLTTSCRLWFFGFQQKRAAVHKDGTYKDLAPFWSPPPRFDLVLQAKQQVKVRSIIFLQTCLPPNTVRFIFLNKCSCSCALRNAWKSPIGPTCKDLAFDIQQFKNTIWEIHWQDGTTTKTHPLPKQNLASNFWVDLSMCAFLSPPI